MFSRKMRLVLQFWMSGRRVVVRFFDLFNGDAEGICVLIQLRRVERLSHVYRGRGGRNISLVERASSDQASNVTVLGIGLDKSRKVEDQLLALGCRVFYVGHHFPGDVLPECPAFQSRMVTWDDTRTNLLIGDYLQVCFHNWVSVVSFGDSLNDVADAFAREAELTAPNNRQVPCTGILARD